MATYIVSYDLRNPDRDYTRLYSRLDAWSALRILESLLLIKVDNSSSTTIRDDLLGYVDKNDRLFVAKLTGEAAWRSLLCTDQQAKEKLTA